MIRSIVLLTTAATASAQAPRASDGHPDLSGIWQGIGTANWDLEDHASEFIQTPDTVAIRYEMIHETRLIPSGPKTYSAPWTATFPLASEPGYEIFEYACHEGNYSMRKRLSAARAAEAKDAAKDAAKEAAGKK
jgi:hypothetical protein